MCQNRKQNNSLEGELVRNVRTRKRLTEKPSPRLVRMPPLLKAEGGRSRTMLEKKKKKKDSQVQDTNGKENTNLGKS